MTMPQHGDGYTGRFDRCGVFYVVFIVVVPETHHGILLKKRAKKLKGYWRLSL